MEYSGKEQADKIDYLFELEQVFENAVEGICIIEKGFNIVRSNNKFRSFLNIGNSELSGKKCYEEFYNELCDSDCPLIKIFSGETFVERDVERKTSDGAMRNYILKATPFLDKNNNLIGIIVFLHDVTERREQEEQFYNAQRIETVARLTGGIAHDFNNMLTTIMGHSDIGIIKCSDDNRDLIENFSEIKITADRAAELVRKLLLFSQRHIVQPKVINPNNFLENNSSFLRKLTKKNIKLVYNTRKKIGNIKIDTGQFEQIITNLVINAQDAMPNGGKITISTENVIIDENFEFSPKEITPGEYILIRFSDNGEGMTKETKEHILEPFFTTRKSNRGKGLGISACYGIVRQNSGFLRIQSVEKEGTTIDVYLPVSQEKIGYNPTMEEYKADSKETEIILLAEDDSSVRKLVSDILSLDGYNVVQASDGEDALRYCNEHDDADIKLLLSDVVMPKMGGLELYKYLREKNSDLKVLFISAFSIENIFENGFLERNDVFLEKPFSPSQLLMKVRKVLGTDTRISI